MTTTTDSRPTAAAGQRLRGARHTAGPRVSGARESAGPQAGNARHTAADGHSDGFADLSLTAVVAGLEGLERETRRLDATRMVYLARAARLGAAGGELESRAIRAELATALHVSEQTVSSHLSFASELVNLYPGVQSVLRAGRVSRAHAREILDAGAIISANRPVDGDPATDAATDATTDDARVLEQLAVQARREEYTARVLVYAVRETPARLRPIARKIAEEYAEASIEERHQVAVRERRVCVIDAEDGMADLLAHIPAVEAHGIYDRLTQMGRKIRLARIVGDSEGTGDASDPNETDTEPTGKSVTQPRTMDELRSDIFTDLLLARDPVMTAGTGVAAIQGRVQVVVPAATVGLDGRGKGKGNDSETKRDASGKEGMNGANGASGANSGPNSANNAGGAGECEGEAGEGPGASPIAPPVLMKHGAIPASTARLVAGVAGHWEKVTVTPEIGDVLKVDRYRPSEKMRRTLAARDLHCRFPGCRAPISRCDIDHTVDAAKGGETSTTNCSHLCRGHHVLKHQTGWKVTQLPGGVLQWESPTGRVHVDRPPSRVYFQSAQAEPPPPGPADQQEPPDLPDPPDPPDPPDAPEPPDAPDAPDASDAPDLPEPPKLPDPPVPPAPF